jgi:hypothetical protein
MLSALSNELSINVRHDSKTSAGTGIRFCCLNLVLSWWFNVIKNVPFLHLPRVYLEARKGGSADVCQFGFVFPCVHLPSVHVPAYAEPCHIPTKHDQALKITEKPFFFCLRMVPDVSYNCKLQLQPHQGALRCLLSTRLLLFLNRKTESRA